MYFLQKKKKKNSPVLLTEGRLVTRVLSFAIPVMLSSMLQIALSTMGSLVIGRYCDSDALSAVGISATFVTLIVNLIVGLSTGASVCTAHSIGTGNRRETSHTVHTAVLTGVLAGVLLGAIGVAIVSPAMMLMDVPAGNIFTDTKTYLYIYFAGLPFTAFYNFGSGILRAVGDSKRPLYYLLISGVANLALDLLFVITFDMRVAGVAVALVVSNAIAAVLVGVRLAKTEGPHKLYLKKLKIYKSKLLRILRLGIPAGIQGAVFSLSNIVIQSSINSLGAAAIAGRTAEANYESLASSCMNAMAQTTVTFVAQHRGAGKTKRMNRAIILCGAIAAFSGILINGLFLLFREPLLGVFIVDDAEAIRQGVICMLMICPFHFICGTLDVVTGATQGLGVAVAPTVMSLAGTCGVRLIWIYAVFNQFSEAASEVRAQLLYAIYPISWVITLTGMAILFFVTRKRMIKNGQLMPE